MGKSTTGRKKSHSVDRGLETVGNNRIVIDEKRGLVFASEEELYNHFLPQIQTLEKEFFLKRSDTDFSENQFGTYEELLGNLLDDPDEIWEDAQHIHGFRVHTYVGHFSSDTESLFYVAQVYRTGDTPSFVYLHFPSKDASLIETYRKGRLIYDRVLKEVENGAVEGDALSEGDDLAVGLYKAMIKLRSTKDIQEEEFKQFEALREGTIEEPDEIWRTNDLNGNILVTFIRDYSDEAEEELKYVVVTIEDTASSSHALLFSFPTQDKSLVERYRHGENLQAEEVVQEASH
jgi:hypothetical protein